MSNKDSVERVFLACDVANIWKSCKEEYGEDARVNFEILKNILPSIRKTDHMNIKATAYIVTHPKATHQKFEEVLGVLGYDVKERVMRFAKGQEGPLRSDWDVGITIDALERLDEYDTFALVSGDGDFCLLLEALKKKGKRTVVFTFASVLSKMLYDVADEVFYLSEDIIYRQANDY